VKRINPKTGKFFKRGDLRGDGIACTLEFTDIN